MTCEEKVHILQQNTLIPGEDSSVYTGQAHETPHFVFAESSFVTDKGKINSQPKPLNVEKV